MLWGRRYDLANVLYCKYCTYDGESWSAGNSNSIVGGWWADEIRACTSSENKGLLVWDKDPGDDGRCHGFSTSAGGNPNIVAVDGDDTIQLIHCCKLDDDRIIICINSTDSPMGGRAYAITLEDENNPHKPTVGDELLFLSGDYAYNPNCCRIDDTHFLIVFEDNSDSSKGKSIYCTVDWETLMISSSDTEIFSQNDIGGDKNFGIGLDSNTNAKIALAYRDNDDNSYLKVLVGEQAEANVSISVSGVLDELLSAEEINKLYTLQEIEYLFSENNIANLYTFQEINRLYGSKELTLYSTATLSE